jgi:hypothetical protein
MMQIELTAFPYDSEVIRYESDGMPVYDRAITSKEYRNLFLKYFTEGVFPNPSDNFQIVENSSQGALVKKGYANVRGVLIELKQDTPITFEQADSLDRIDRVVLRHNDTKSVRYADVVILKGSPSNSPQAPNITRDETIWDIVLADVRIRKNSSNVTQAQITDRRLDSELCGIVAGTIKEVDTTTLYNQIQSDLSQFKENEQAEFLEWFEKIKGQLGEDQAGNLQLQVNELDARTDTLEEAMYTGDIIQTGSQYSGGASDYGIEVLRIEGAYQQDGIPSPELPIEPKFFHATNFYTSGKNIFDGQLELGSIDNLTGELSSDNKCLRSKNFIRVIQNSTVTLSNDLGYACYIYEYDSNKGFIKYTSKSETNTLKLSDSTNFIKFRSVSGQTQNNLNVKYQLETSYSKSEYTPFKGSSSTPVDIELRALPNGVKDTYENGLITRRVGVATFDGSDDEPWVTGGMISDGVHGYYISIPTIIGNSDGDISNDMICNRYIQTSINNALAKFGYFRRGGGGQNKATYFYNDISSLADWKNNLKSNPITVWYELATPTTEQYQIPVLPSYYPFTNAWCDSELETNVTWNVLTGKSAILDGQGNLIKKGYITPNDNLLTNSDFKSGIINQKGQKQYGEKSTWNYGIDMWKIINCGINVEASDINVYSTKEGYMSQNVDGGLTESEYTVAVYVSLLNQGKAYVYLEGTGKVDEYEINKTGLRIYTFKSVTKGVGLSFRFSGFNGNIDYVKLEKGSRFTGMKPWNKGIEFAKCINKYRFELNNYYPIYEITGNKAIIPINHNGMDKKPSVIVDGGFCKGADGLTATFTSYKVVENKDNSTTVEVTFNKNIQGTSACLNVIIDSYDY